MNFPVPAPLGYTSSSTTSTNPLRVAELRLAPTFAHIVAFSITYELVAVICNTSFVGGLFLLGPSFSAVAVFVELEHVLSGVKNVGTLAGTGVELLLWSSRLTGKVSILMCANLVARLVSTALHQMQPAFACLYILYLLALGYSAGRASGTIL